LRRRSLRSTLPNWRTGITIIVGSMLLGSCGGGSGSATATQNTAVQAPGFAFTRVALPGVYGSPAVSYLNPPFVFQTTNDGNGNLTAVDLTAAGVANIYSGPRVPYDLRLADFNGDGIPDVISTVYSATNIDSWAYLYFGNADGTFTQDTSFGMQYVGPGGPGYRGRTESIVVADFNNDGSVDVFLPTYTFLDATFDLSGDPQTYVTAGPPPNVRNAPQSYLLLNDGTGKFVEHSVAAGVSMHSLLSGLSPDTTDPDGVQPEGAQAVDFNLDGLIDLYVGGHLFINQGVDAAGVPHFKDMAAAYGLTAEMLRSAVPGAGGALPSNYLITDEGAQFVDWNNSGHLSLLLLRWDWGAAHGPRLFEFDGVKFTERTAAVRSATPTCKSPADEQAPFFSSTRPVGGTGSAFGMNTYDLDDSGLQDVLVSGDQMGPAIYRNTGCGFVEVSAGDLDGHQGNSGGMAMADLDDDGTIDVLYPAVDGNAYYKNTTPKQGSYFIVEVVGPNGEHNQFGRVLQVSPPNTSEIYTRIVDSGSGYLTQNQYPVLIGTPYAGSHTVKVYFAPLTKCVYGGAPCAPIVLSFTLSPGQRALAYAPSSSYPGGRATVSSASSN